jgi:predicted amidohydrolase
MKKFLFLVFFLLVLTVDCSRKNDGNLSIVISGREIKSPVSGKTVRAFSIAHKHTLDIGSSEDAYYKKMRGMMEAVRDKIASDRINIFVFPEDAGLVLAFMGSRGEQGRSEKFALNAFFDLFNSYSTAINFYIKRFGSQSPSRILLISLTDTLWRPFYNTFSSLSREFGVYVLSCTNVAEALLSTDPEAVTALGDPDYPQRTDVYVAYGPDVWNTCFLFDPDGNIVHRTKKVNLVPEERDLLDLSKGTLSDVTVFNIPGTSINLCVGISLDAFIPEYVRHLDEQGCNVFLQPDANPGMWAAYYPYWQPDDWLGSVMGTMQYTNIQYNVNPMMTGNFFDMVFDGQSAITAKYDGDIRRDINYIGNLPLTPGYDDKYPAGGFLLLGPWLEVDIAEGSSLEGMRESYRQKSLALASPAFCESNDLDPGLCGAEENQYLETILWADLVVR